MYICPTAVGSSIFSSNLFSMTFTYLYIYIYIYCQPQTDCFIVSQLFSVARHVGRLKLGSKTTQLYVRLSIRPLGQQVYPVGLGNYKVLCSNSNSSIHFCLHFIPYQNAQFVQRGLHYVGDNRKFLCQSAQPPHGAIKSIWPSSRVFLSHSKHFIFNKTN